MSAPGVGAPGGGTLMWASEYPRMYGVENRLWWYAGLRQVVDHFLPRRRERAPRILDAGCGTGKNAEFLRARGRQTWGIEYSDDALRFCQARGLDRLVRASVAELPFAPGCFDGLICLDVIGLLPPAEADRAVAEFHRVLRPGGVAVVHAAALEWLRSQHDDVCNLRHRYTTAELRRLFPERDWVVRRCTYRVFLLFPPVALVKLARRLTRRAAEQSTGDLVVPPAPVNRALGLVQTLENALLRRFDFPVGSSALLVATRR